MNYQQRLDNVAQRLDELADDGPEELAVLAEELVEIANHWPTPQSAQVRSDRVPEWLANIQQVVERAAMEIVAERYGQAMGPDSRYMTLNLPNPAYDVHRFQEMRRIEVGLNSDVNSILKSLNGGV